MVVYIEHQGRVSDLFTEYLFRLGAAYLWNDDFQIENFRLFNKNTPHQLFLNAGVSYRLDFHKDFTSAEELQEKELKKQERLLKKH